MTVRRRVILQMTPLLDLLLVVIFAQYMDMRNSSRNIVQRARHASLTTLKRERSRSHDAVSEAQDRIDKERDLRKRAQAERDLVFAQSKVATTQLAPLAAKNEILKYKNARLQKDLEQLAKANVELAKKIKDDGAAERLAEMKRRREAERLALLKAQKDLDEIGRVVRDMFSMDEDVMKAALVGRPAGETAKILAELRTIRSGTKAAAMIHHLRKTVELRKRCDFWEFHIFPDNSVRIKIRGQVVEPKLFFQTLDDFTHQVLTLIKRQEDPKDLIIILVSYSDAQYGTISRVEKGLDKVMTILDTFWKRTRRLHVSNLGYTEKAP